MNLTVENLTKEFKGKKVLDIPHYAVRSGEIIGLVGNNGAGKTTLFRVILDLLKADTGHVVISGVIDGREVSIDTSKNEAWKAYTGAFVDTGAKVTGLTDSNLNERLKFFDQFMNGEVMGSNTLIRNLSMGNQQKVGIIGAMLHHPQLLILDEPFNFLDPTSQVSMKYLLEKYGKEYGSTIIVSSHNLTHTLDVCSRITLLENGNVIKDYGRDYALLTSEIEGYFRSNVNI